MINNDFKIQEVNIHVRDKVEEVAFINSKSERIYIFSKDFQIAGIGFTNGMPYDNDEPFTEGFFTLYSFIDGKLCHNVQKDYSSKRDMTQYNVPDKTEMYSLLEQYKDIALKALEKEKAKFNAK